jgi:eukaryotic-like serine/threonine-protein kinase
MLLSVGDKIGPYEIGAALGAGGMGEVYRAHDSKLARDIALKVLPKNFANDSDRMARFEREARVLASLNHPNIGAIYGLEESNGVRALIMELVEGPSLEQRMAKGPLQVAEALDVARQLAAALDYAHEKGVVHRDLKPANVKLTPDGQVKVLDFGLAKAFSADAVSGDPASSPTMTMHPGTLAGMILGTAAYMAPEQARGCLIDKRADVWAFGVVLFEMLTGPRLFEGESISDTLAAVLTKEPDWSKLPAAMPIAMRRLIQRCLVKDRKRRLRDIGDAFFEEGDDEKPGAPRTRRWVPVVLAGFLGAALVVLTPIHLRGPSTEAPLLTLDVTLPEKTSAAGILALSPDGRRLAIPLRDTVTGNVALWVRSLDSLNMQMLAGTENGYFPFWSPDSRSVAFFAENKLKRVDLAGGPPQIICESGTGRGGAWNRDGTILFARSGSGILLVPATGGDPRELTQIDHSRKEIRHYWPCLLPGGRRLLFTVLGANPAAEGIWIASVNNPQDRRRLIGGRGNAMYSRGWIFFIRNGVLMAQRLDSERGQLEQEAVRVVEKVAFIGGLGFGAATVSETGSLAYMTLLPGIGGGLSGARGRLTWIDRRGQSLGTVGELAVHRYVALSPDQTRIATDVLSPQQGNFISILDPRRGTAAQLTFSPNSTSSPVWSHDGARIAYASSVAGTYDLYQKLASGTGQEEPLLRSDRPKFSNDWSPDGRYLLYHEVDPNTQNDLWVLPLGPDGQDRKPFPFLQTRFDERDGKFSPDGRWIAYVSDESSRLQVYVQSFPAGTLKVPISTNGGAAPHWRRDGRELYYLSPDGQLMAVEVKTGNIFRAGVPHALFDTHGAPDFDAAIDGSKFLLAMPESVVNEPVHVVLNWTAPQK